MRLLAFIAITTAVMSAEQSAREALKATTVAALDRYLTEYEPQLSALVADEVFRQEAPPLTTADPYLKRRLDSEVAFARLPDAMSWIGFRRVMKVDGRAVAQSGPTLAALLSLGPTDRLAQAQLLVMQGSEHNLGLPRTTNLPNLPLELLQPKYRGRFSISLEDSERIRGPNRIRPDVYRVGATFDHFECRSPGPSEPHAGLGRHCHRRDPAGASAAECARDLR